MLDVSQLIPDLVSDILAPNPDTSKEPERSGLSDLDEIALLREPSNSCIRSLSGIKGARGTGRQTVLVLSERCREDRTEMRDRTIEGIIAYILDKFEV